MTIRTSNMIKCLILHSHQKLNCLKSGVSTWIHSKYHSYQILHHFWDILTFWCECSIIHLEHPSLCLLNFHALLVIHLNNSTWKSLSSVLVANICQNDHILKIEKKNTKIFKVCLPYWTVCNKRTICKTFNIYVGRTIRNMWLDQTVCTFVIQHDEISYLLYFENTDNRVFCMENTWKRIFLFPLHINSSLN